MGLRRGAGDLISREAVLRGNLLALGFSAVTGGLGAVLALAARRAWGAPGRANPEPAPAGQPGFETLRFSRHVAFVGGSVRGEVS